MKAMLCSTPRCGSTALLEAIRGAIPGAREYPDAEETDGVYFALVHWPQMPVSFEPDKIVYLYRDDKLAQAVSWAVAAGTGRFHSTQQPKCAEPAVSLGDVAVLRGQIKRFDLSWRQWLDGKPRLEVCYERDLNGRYPEGARRILEWLGVEGEPAPVTLHPVDVELKQGLISAYKGRG